MPPKKIVKLPMPPNLPAEQRWALAEFATADRVYRHELWRHVYFERGGEFVRITPNGLIAELVARGHVLESQSGRVFFYQRARGQRPNLARMSPERRKQIASQGAKALHKSGKAHRWAPGAEASAAGKKGACSDSAVMRLLGKLSAKKRWGTK